MLVYSSGVDVSSSALRFLAARLRERRRTLGTRWRRLSAGRQALLTLAHLRNGRPYAQLAAGFGIGTTTVYRYVNEAVELLAALAPTLADAVRAASMKAFVILDGTLLPIDRIAADRPFYSGKHKKHGMNVQVIADPKGRLLWASPALAGAVHDVRAAREHGIIDALAEAGINCWADKGHQGAGGTVRLPYRGRWDRLSAGQQAVNRSHAKVRALVEQAIATLKSWRLLRKLRCSNTIASAAAGLPAPRVTLVRSLTVEKVDSMGFVVRRWIQCSAGKS
ncbi:IS5 family transposase [Streptomyces antibioticus]|uniref:IS5 family transposase n=1 Tax=Streptomyces antibioticus TaxID=1890 RepID=UPI003D70E1CC